MLLRKNILGDYTLSLDSLRKIRWFLILKFAKASKRFYRVPTLRSIVVAHWAHAVASVLGVCLTAGIHPAGKVW